MDFVCPQVIYINRRICDLRIKREEMAFMKGKILKILLENENYISGQKICEELEVSRTAVWKTVKQLKEDGYEIESVNNKGYRIISCPDLVTKEAVESRIKTKLLGKFVVYKEEVDSTNEEAKRLSNMKTAHGLLVIADRQTGGKGRRGRGWESSKKEGIFMSLLLKPDFEPLHASMLTLVAALAVTRGIYELTELPAQIKWPNDIVVNGKKVCGILTEMSAEPDYINYIVVGIGINANTERFSDEIEDKATSLLLESGNAVNRSGLICRVLEAFEHYYEIFMQTKDLTNLTAEYDSYLVSNGKAVKVMGNKEPFMGTAKGINEKGELLVETEDGIISVMSGEVSVRGLYGYV